MISLEWNKKRAVTAVAALDAIEPVTVAMEEELKAIWHEDLLSHNV